MSSKGGTISSRRLACAAGLGAFAGLIAAGWFSLVAADLDAFNPWVCIGAGLAVAAFAFAIAFRRSDSNSDSRFLFAAVIIGALTLFATLPPGEVVLGGWDPGVYVHTAAMAAKTGSLRFEQPDLKALAGEEAQLVSRHLGPIREPFGGMRIIPDGRLSPQFYHFYPMVMAMLYAAGGVRAALLLNPLLNVAAVVLVYLLASRFAGKRWGLVAAVTLALLPAQIWQARFPTAEMLTQVLLLGGFVLLHIALTSPGNRLLESVLAGAAFGAAMLTRYDTLMMLLPMSLILLPALARRDYRARLLPVFAMILAMSLHAWLHQKYVAPYYRPLGPLVIRVSGMLVACAALAALAARIVVRSRPAVARLRALELPLRAAAALAFAVWLTFAWYVRPRLTVDGTIASIFGSVISPESGLRAFLAGPDAYNFSHLLSNFGLLGTGLAMLGVLVLLFRARDWWSVAWLAPSIGIMSLLVTRVFNDHFMMWVSRRYIPVVIPLLAVGTAAACWWISSRWKHAWAIALLLLVVALGMNARNTRAMAAHHEWPGLISWMQGLADRLPEADRIYCDQAGFAAALRFLHDKPAFELHFAARQDRRERLLRLLRQRAATETILLLTPKSDGLDGQELVLEAPLKSSMLATPRTRVPRKTKPRGAPFRLYRISPLNAESAPAD